MKNKLTIAVKAEFARQIAIHLPDFHQARNSKLEVYELRVGPDLFFFVFLSVAEGKDSFVLEVAANDKDEFPWAATPGTTAEVGSTANTVWRFRISKLWGEVKSHMWSLGEARDHRKVLLDVRQKTFMQPENLDSKLKEVVPKVQDAVNRLCEYGIPYFEAAAEKHGYKLRIRTASDR